MSKLSLSQALKIAKSVNYKGSMSEFYMGLHVEMEHSKVVGGSMLKVGEIVKNHLDERRDYYSFGVRKHFFSREEVGL